MRPVLRRMRTEPSRCRTVTVFATDSVAKLEGLRLLLRRHIERVADQALSGLGRRSDIQNFADSLGDAVLEHAESTGVLVLRNPDRIFVLKNARGGLRLHAAMAATGRASAATVVFTGSNRSLIVERRDRGSSRWSLAGGVRILRPSHGEQHEERPRDRQPRPSQFALSYEHAGSHLFGVGCLYDESVEESTKSGNAPPLLGTVDPRLDMQCILL